MNTLTLLCLFACFFIIGAVFGYLVRDYWNTP